MTKLIEPDIARKIQARSEALKAANPEMNNEGLVQLCEAAVAATELLKAAQEVDACFGGRGNNLYLKSTGKRSAIAVENLRDLIRKHTDPPVPKSKPKSDSRREDLRCRGCGYDIHSGECES